MVAMANEGTSRSCLLYVSSANAKLPAMPTNPAETPESENAGKVGVCDDFSRKNIDRRVSVAPMMDWTDRHCRFFLRGFSPAELLYTEMINARAIVRGDRARLLAFDPAEHPLA